MNIEQIKATTDMRNLLESYGVEIRRGRCRGFCHGGRDFNMAVNDKRCHCFVCNRSFDVFEAVKFFENCDFKAALSRLGGDTAACDITEKQREQIAIAELKRRQRKRKEELWLKICKYNQDVLAADIYFKEHGEMPPEGSMIFKKYEYAMAHKTDLEREYDELLEEVDKA